MPAPGSRRPQKGERLSAQLVRDIMDRAEGVHPSQSATSKSELKHRRQIICVIMEHGPNGEADFCDARYWVKAVKLSAVETMVPCDGPPCMGDDCDPPPPPCVGDECDPPPPPCIGADCDEPPPPCIDSPGCGGPFHRPENFPGCHGPTNPWNPFFADVGPCIEEAHGPVGRPIRNQRPIRSDVPQKPRLAPGARSYEEFQPQMQGEVFGVQTSWIDFQTSLAVWTPALNILEVEANTHELDPGSPVIVFEMTAADGRPFLAFNPGGGGSGGGTARVIIERVIARPEDAIVEPQQLNYEAYGPHLSCFRVGADNNPIITQRVVVYPPGHKSADQFKFGTEHIYRLANPFPPIFTAIRHPAGVWTLAFAEAQILTAPPDRNRLCQSNMAEGVGACCYTDAQANPWCLDMPSGVCLEQGGNYKGDGTTCNQIVSYAASCEPGAAACCWEGGDGPTCTNLTEPQCEQLAGSWHEGTQCTADFCDNPFEFNGACCLPTFGCVGANSEGECTGVYGGTYRAGEICDPTLCMPAAGACCSQSVECQHTFENACCESGDGFLCVFPTGSDPQWQGPGTTCDDCP